MKRIVVSVLNDLATDQRVDKICTTLTQMGFLVVLIGKKSKTTIAQRTYKTVRINLLFKKGFFYFAEYNLRLFLKLFFLKKDILLANDLDTLLPNYLISKLFKKHLVYDSHELYTEMPELIDRPKVQKFWLLIEKNIFPKLKNVYTVNKIIADIYSSKYKVPVKVIRNIAPKLQNKKIDLQLSKKIKGNKKMLILQGAGINMDRGAEEAIQMMQYIDNTLLYIIGGGEVFEQLKALIKNLKLEHKVILKERMPYLKLMEYTKITDIGLSLDKGSNLNYEYSLPNKIFDYIQAEIPLLVSNRKIVAALIHKEGIGKVTKTHNPKELASIVQEMLSKLTKNAIWKENLKKCSQTYCWENEKKALIKIYQNLA